ncbi:MAG: Crp/Fnr family transcriptional regulator [Candidatus Thiodiazotropha sp.]
MTQDERFTTGTDWLSQDLLQDFSRRDLPAGYLLATPESARNEVFVVHSGRLRVYLAGENRSLTLSFLETGDIYTSHTPTFVESVSETTLWVMDTEAFARKLGQDPSATPAIMRVLGRLLSNAVSLVEDLAFREVPARLARFMLGLARRKGQADEGGWRVPLELTIEEIASLLGTTRQTVSMLINQWEREGLVARPDRQHLLIPSLDRLHALCGENSTRDVG